MTDTEVTLLRRIERLERRARWSRALLLLLTALAATAATDQAPPSVLEATRLIIRDNSGAQRAEFGINAQGYLVFRVAAGDGTDAVRLSLSETGFPTLRLATPTTMLTIDAGRVILTDLTRTKRLAQLGIDNSGYPALIFADPSGGLPTAFGIGSDGTAQLKLNGSGSAPEQLRLTATAHGADLVLDDTQGTEYIRLAGPNAIAKDTRTTQDPQLVLRDRKGDVVWVAPTRR